MERLPRKLKKKYSKIGRVLLKNNKPSIIIQDCGEIKRSVNWTSKYVVGIDAYDENTASKSMGAGI